MTSGCALGLSVSDLASRADMTVDDVECIEEGGTEPTVVHKELFCIVLRTNPDVRLW